MGTAKMNFEVGDIVRRIKGSWAGVKQGDIDTVAAVARRSIELVGHDERFAPEHFELVTEMLPVPTPTTGFPPGHYATFTPESDEQPPSPITVQVGGDHYRKMAIQPMEYILANDIPFVEGCVIKYVSRWKNKGGLQDLKKARHNLDFLIEHAEKQVAK